MKNEENSVKSVYFMFPCYAIGGGELLIIRIIEHLLKYTDIKVGIIDFSDGTLYRTCKKFFPKNDIEYIEYRQSSWNLEDDAVIFTSADHLGCIKPHTGENVRISIVLWENGISWKTLFEKRKIPAVSKLINQNDAMCFMDYGCYTSGCRQLNQVFEKNYLPIFFQKPVYQHFDKKTPDNEINMIWLGRLSEAKEQSIYNIVENFYNYKTQKKKVFHIIGNGTQEHIIKKNLKKYEDKIKFIFTGVINGDALFQYIRENADIGVAMGTSALTFAALKIPVLMAHEHPTPFFSNEFGWLFDMYDYCTGSPVIKDEFTLPMFQNLSSFDQLLDDITLNGKKEPIGKKCFQYYADKHNDLKKTAQAFIDCVGKTTLTYEMLKKTLKFMPYDGRDGLEIYRYNIMGLPFLKVFYHGYTRRYYIFGLKVFKRISTPQFFKFYLFFIKVFQIKRWGRYSFPSTTSETIREECKDKYAINDLYYNE